MVGVAIPFLERKERLGLDQQCARSESLMKVINLRLTQVKLM